MGILKVVEKLESISQEYVGLMIDEEFAKAVGAATKLLVEQGERIADLEAEREKVHSDIIQILTRLEDGCLGVQKAAFAAARKLFEGMKQPE